MARAPRWAQAQWLLQPRWGRRRSVGERCGLLAETAAAGARAYAEVLREARASPLAHGDETGWREDGHNGFGRVPNSPISCPAAPAPSSGSCWAAT